LQPRDLIGIGIEGMLVEEVLVEGFWVVTSEAAAAMGAAGS